MNSVIRTRGLRKHYGRVRALDGLDLSVDSGEIHGFLGPNGAGKSTAIRVLLGLARSTGGDASVFGLDPWRDAVAIHRRVAYIPGDVSVWPNLTGGEAIDLLARLRGARTGADAYRDERRRLTDAFQFDPRKKGRAYSKGNRQKVALIAAFAVPAELYVFDEPTSGLDPLMEVVFRREVARAKAAGSTVLLSSHILSEAEQLCDRLSIIRAGRIVEVGTLAELRHLTRTAVSFAGDRTDAVAALAHAHDITAQDGRIHFTVDTDAVAGILPALAAVPVTGLRIEPPSLEDVFLRHYGDDLGAPAGERTVIGLGSLLVLRLRRDALQLTLWIAGTALLGLLGRVGIANSYADEQERAGLLAAAVANPVVLLFRGLPSGAREGAFLAFLLVPWMCLLAAFMSSFLAVRHTRGDEEAGRAELVAATPAGMITPLAATILHGLIANAALALLTASALLATGLPMTGSVVVGAAAGAVGVVFLGVGLVAGQVQRTSRGANALAVWTLLATFLACGIGNALGRPSDDLQRIESSWLAWLSPFGWAENTRPFDADALWPLLVCAAVALALIVVAASLQRGRDLGESLIPQRSGRATAGRSLRGNASLVWRLSRGAVAGWAVGGLVTGLLSTSLASVVAEVGATNPAVLEIIEQIAGRGNAEQGTIAVFFTMLGVLAACCAVQVMCRARQEETAGTAEAVLASAVHRVRWLADHLLIAAVALVLVIAAGAAGAALGLVAQGGDVVLMRDVAVVGGGQAAAASVFLAVTALVFVIAPRGTIALGWTLVALGMVLGLFGPLFGFPEWLSGLSPVGSAPLVDGDAILIRGLWWTLAASGVGLSAALLLMRRRELAGG